MAGEMNLDLMSEVVGIQRAASATGFDWPDVSGVLAKVREELDEVEAALAGGGADALRDEVGDLLFSALNVARYVNVDPVDALRGTAKRFSDRVRMVEDEVRRSGRAIETCTLEELDAIWERVKRSRPR